MNLNLEDEEPMQSLFAENEAKSFLQHNEVNYIEIYTNKKNLLEIKNINPDENQNNQNQNNANEDMINKLGKTKSKLNETPLSKDSKTKTGFSNKTKTSKSKNTNSKFNMITCWIIFTMVNCVTNINHRFF